MGGVWFDIVVLSFCKSGIEEFEEEIVDMGKFVVSLWSGLLIYIKFDLFVIIWEVCLW